MASTPEDIDRVLSRVLHALGEAHGVYSNATGKGDGREELVRENVRLRMGTMFGVDKAEIVDSNGSSCLEHDIVIYDQGSAACLYTIGGRRVVRVESVAVTMEVKSFLNADTIKQVDAALVEGLARMKRFLLPANLHKELVSAAPDAFRGHIETLRAGMNPLEGYKNVPPVINAIFAYGGPSQEAAERYLDNPHIDAICVLGKYCIAKNSLGFGEPGGDNVALWGLDEDAFGSFLCFLENMVELFRLSRHWVSADLFRYYTQRPSYINRD